MRGALAGNAQAVSPKAPPVKAAAPEIRVTEEQPDTSITIDGERTIKAKIRDEIGCHFADLFRLLLNSSLI